MSKWAKAARRATGMCAIADMVVNLIQATALGLTLNPLGSLDRALLSEPLPPPMHPNNRDAQNRLCSYGEAFKPYVDAAASTVCCTRAVYC